MLPVGVILPTLNSRPLLESHLDSLTPWLDLAQQVVVVDSFSTDGTLEFLRSKLRHSNVSFLTHPPGLYQSWNHAIAQLQTQYTYISTIGETITRPGLEHLVENIRRFQTDLIISPPAFLDAQQQPLPNLRWPIHELIADLQVASPQPLDKWTVFFYVCLHALGESVNSLLGSSASNLYQTAALQKHPFPGRWGTAGDTAWSVANMLDLRWSISPLVCSTFLFHAKTNGNRDQLNQQLSEHLAAQAGLLLNNEMSKPFLQQDPALAELLFNLLKTLPDLRQQHFQLQRLRSAKAIPWLLKPQAWRARAARQRLQQRLSQLKAQFLKLRPLTGRAGCPQHAESAGPALTPSKQRP